MEKRNHKNEIRTMRQKMEEHQTKIIRTNC